MRILDKRVRILYFKDVWEGIISVFINLGIGSLTKLSVFINLGNRRWTKTPVFACFKFYLQMLSLHLKGFTGIYTPGRREVVGR